MDLPKISGIKTISNVTGKCGRVSFSVFQKRTMSLTSVYHDQNRIFVVAGTLLCEGFYLLVSNWCRIFLLLSFVGGILLSIPWRLYLLKIRPSSHSSNGSDRFHLDLAIGG